MQEMRALILKNKLTLIYQMSHDPNSLPSSLNAFHPPPIIPMFNFLQ